MNRSPDVELVLRDYFADDISTAPDHVLDVIEERIWRQPQQRSWRLLWRLPVNAPIKLAAAVAAVLVVAVAGFAMFGRPSESNIGGTVTPTPSPSLIPSASPSAAASASAVFPSWYTPESDRNGAGILPAGSGTTQSFLRGSTFSVPEGWVSDFDTANFYGLWPDTPANQAEFDSSGNLANTILMDVVDNPRGLICDGVGDAVGSNAADLADSLVANEALVTSKPVEVSIGDLTGVRVDSYLDPDGTGSCPDKDARARFVFLDIPDDGKLLIVLDSAHAADFETFLAEAMPVVESFEFNLEP